MCTLITFASSVVVSMVIPTVLGRIWGYNFIFNILGSLFLFLFFSKLDFESKKINYFASFALGVYFVHTDPIVYDFLYGTLLRTDEFWFSPWFIVHTFISIVFVYIIATIIDMGRKWLFDTISKFIMPFFKKHTPIIWKQIP